MKRILSFIVLTLLLSIFLVNGGISAYALGPVWVKEFSRDVFGDPTDEWYITNKNSFSGTYNSATAENAPLGADIRIGLKGISILLYENGKEKLKNSSDDHYEYIIAIKKADGGKVVASGTMRRGTDEIEVLDTTAFIEALYGRGKASIYLEREDQKITNYLFNVECDNFEALFKEELYLVAKQYRQNGDYISAEDIFIFLGEYKDSKELGAEALNARCYADAEEVLKAGKYKDAIAAFEKLGDYQDSQVRADEARDALYGPDYAKAEALFSSEKYEEAIQVYKELNGYKDSLEQIKAAQDLIPARDYMRAEALLEAKDYDGAIAAFEALGSYSDSSKRAKDAIEAMNVYLYAKATALVADGDYENALQIFKDLGEYRDSAEKAKEIISTINARDYAEAEKLLQSDQLIAAVKKFESLVGYQDSKERAETIKQTEKYQNAKIAHANVGETIIFGSYEQDGNTSNGKEPIEWLVLAKEGDSILVISKYALDRQPYHDSKTDGLKWRECALRKWLNQEFLNAAFTSEQQARIPFEFSKTDKVSLLSEGEVKSYLSKRDRLCYPTEYAKEEYLKTKNTTKAVYWALRLDDFKNNYLGPSVNDIGGFSLGLGLVQKSYIRPAIWIDISDYIK